MIRSLFDLENSPEEEKKPDAPGTEQDARLTLQNQAETEAEREPKIPVNDDETETAGMSKPVIESGIDPEENLILELDPFKSERSIGELEEKVARIEQELEAEKGKRRADPALIESVPGEPSISEPDNNLTGTETPVLKALSRANSSEQPTRENTGDEFESKTDQYAQTHEPLTGRSDYETSFRPENLDPSDSDAKWPPAMSEYEPESRFEVIRNSGIAWTAAIALFGSVAFMLIIGWFADLLLGTSPWGVIGGIVIGSILGFYQFFRLTSQIMKK